MALCRLAGSNRTLLAGLQRLLLEAVVFFVDNVGLAIDALHAWNEADAADILLLDDDIEALPRAMRIARSQRRIQWENFGALLGMKLLVLLLALCNVIPVGLAALLLTVSSAFALVNSLRAFGLK